MFVFSGQTIFWQGIQQFRFDPLFEALAKRNEIHLRECIVLLLILDLYTLAGQLFKTLVVSNMTFRGRLIRNSYQCSFFSLVSKLCPWQIYNSPINLCSITHQSDPLLWLQLVVMCILFALIILEMCFHPWQIELIDIVYKGTHTCTIYEVYIWTLSPGS